jgi:SAM-dependent methyltransferase
MKLVHVRCNNCGKDEATPIAQGTDHEYHTAPDVFRMVRCPCGLIYMDPRPDASALDVIYPSDYYAYELVKRRAQASGGDSWLARFMGRRAIERLAPYVRRVTASPRDRYRVLDVGCGDGTVLGQWRQAFEAPTETVGIEMNADAAEIARAAGHEVITSRIEDARLPAASFDLVYSFHVIEHVEDPSGFLRAARDAVRPSGLVLLDTPNVDTLDFRLFSRGSWGAYHFPRHFTLYDPKTITALAHKSGFDVVEITYAPAAIFWVWTLHAMLEPRARAVADRLFPPVEIFTRGSPWNVALLGAFTLVDRALVATTGRCAQMRVLLKPAA